MATSLDEGPQDSAPAAREEFWNLPNTITIVRMGVVPIFLLFPLFDGPTGSRVVAWLFIVAATTDLVDGWLARRGKQVTSIGKLLDPLADKLLVSTGLLVLLALDRVPAGGRCEGSPRCGLGGRARDGGLLARQGQDAVPEHRDRGAILPGPDARAA